MTSPEIAIDTTECRRNLPGRRGEFDRCLLGRWLDRARTIVGTIPQPAQADILAVHPDFVLAPQSERVDLMRPTFSNPTKITNPLFPVATGASVLYLGTKDGKPLRTEVTTLPYTRVIDWDGQRVETLVSQYTLFLDGRIAESAIDWYAQADDGAVWYFGEDVNNYDAGAVVTTNGTWLAGKDGPAAMIMPGRPAIGQVFRPENIPGLVFEEVKVTKLDQTFDGPIAPVTGGLVAGEVHKDGSVSEKLFAPGYGEWRSSSATELEEVALAVPTNAIAGPMPAEIAALATGAGSVFDAASAADWGAASTELTKLSAAWATARAGPVPRRIRDLMDAGLTELAGSVASRNRAGASQSAANVMRLGLDLQLRHRPVSDIDLARMDVWSRQLLVDAAANNEAVLGDVVGIKFVRDRLLNAVDRPALAKIDSLVSQLEDAASGPDFAEVTQLAGDLREQIAASAN